MKQYVRGNLHPAARLDKYNGRTFAVKLKIISLSSEINMEMIRHLFSFQYCASLEFTECVFFLY